MSCVPAEQVAVQGCVLRSKRAYLDLRLLYDCTRIRASEDDAGMIGLAERRDVPRGARWACDTVLQMRRPVLPLQWGCR